MPSTPNAPTTRLMNSVTLEPTMTEAATALPFRNDRFGRPYTMLSADSSALKSETDDQRRNTPPMMPSVAALSCTLCTRLRIPLTEVPGKAWLSSFTRKSDASARWTRPSSASARKTSGTKESSAKYATIAARCVPRSAKNFATRDRFRRRTSGSLHPVSLGGEMDAAQALADLTEISSQIESAVLFDEQGAVLGSTLADESAAKKLAQVAAELLE